jgi:hypothetical protein
MSRRSSLGVTVLALVAFHSLSPIGLVATEQAAIHRLNDRSEHLGASEVLSTLKNELEAGRIGEEEEIFPFIPATIGELIELWQPDATKCSDDFFRQVTRWIGSSYGSLNSYICEAREKRQNFCFSHLEQQIKEQIGSALKESTKERFESFVTKYLRIYDQFESSVWAIIKLRRVIESPENADKLDIGKEYLRACEDVIERCASIKPIRAKYLTTAFVTPTKIWPHVQFYDFCRHLIDFDFAQQIDSALDRYSNVVESFNDRLDQNQAQSMSGPNAETISIGTAKNDLEQEQSLAEAAVRYADDWAKGRWIEISRDQDGYMRTRALSCPSKNSVPATRENGLNDLKETCVGISSAQNFLWMQKNGLLRPAHGDTHEPTTERKLRFLKACEHLVKLKNKEIIEQARKILATEQRKPRKNLIAKLLGADQPK